MDQVKNNNGEGTIVRIRSGVNTFSFVKPWQLNSDPNPSMGTGWVTPLSDSKGNLLVMTCWHVVALNSPSAPLLIIDGELKCEARVYIAFVDIDACLLRIDTENNTSEVIENTKKWIPWCIGSGLRRSSGDKLVAIGFPLESTTLKVVTININGTQGLLIQIDGAINPGHSGAPVIYDGKVIGWISEGIQNANSVSFCRPIEMVAALWPYAQELILKQVQKRYKMDGSEWMLIRSSPIDEIFQSTSPTLQALAKAPEVGMLVQQADPKYSLFAAGDWVTEIFDFTPMTFASNENKLTSILDNTDAKLSVKFNSDHVGPTPVEIFGGQSTLQWSEWQAIIPVGMESFRARLWRDGEEKILTNTRQWNNNTVHRRTDAFYYNPSDVNDLRHASMSPSSERWRAFPQLSSRITLRPPWEVVPYFVVAGLIVIPMVGNLDGDVLANVFGIQVRWQSARHESFLVVASVLGNSPITQWLDETGNGSGIQQGDIIATLNKHAISTLEEYAMVLQDYLHNKVDDSHPLVWKTCSGGIFTYQPTSKQAFIESEQTMAQQHGYKLWF